MQQRLAGHPQHATELRRNELEKANDAMSSPLHPKDLQDTAKQNRFNKMNTNNIHS